MTEPNEVTAQLWLAHVHFWGGMLFLAMAATSFAAVAHHLDKAGISKRRNAVELAEEVLRAVQ